jgi:cytoskeletal protein CcmA (bactofilin family)
MFEKNKGGNRRGAEPPEMDSEQRLDPAPLNSSVPKTRTKAMIGPTIRIKGEVSGEENLLIEGRVDGSVSLRGKDLTVGSSGSVNANVSATVVKIDGEVKGDITGEEKVIISNTGKVQGNIVAPRVTLEDGAKFKGSIDMDPNERVVEAKPSSLKSAASPPKSTGEKDHGTVSVAK